MIALVEPSVGSSEPVPVSTLQKTVSASRLNCWLQCRLKFFFRYVLKITKPKTGALHYGSVVHLVLQQWNMGRWRKQPFDIAKLKQVFDAGWLDQGQINWDGEEPDQKTSACRICIGRWLPRQNIINCGTKLCGTLMIVAAKWTSGLFGPVCGLSLYFGSPALPSVSAGVKLLAELREGKIGFSQTPLDALLVFRTRGRL